MPSTRVLRPFCKSPRTGKLSNLASVQAQWHIGFGGECALDGSQGLLWKDSTVLFDGRHKRQNEIRKKKWYLTKAPKF